MCNDRRGGFFEGIVTGAVLGVAAYIFLNTEEGKKIKKKAKPYLHEVADLLEDWKDQSSDLLEKAKEVKDSLEEKLEETKEKVAPQVAEKLEGSLSHIEALQERGREATATIRKKFFKNIKKS